MAKDEASQSGFAFFKGVDNRSAQTALAYGSARSINNFDVDRDGRLSTRSGWRLSSAGVAHSLFSCGSFALAVKDGYLIKITAGPTITNLAAVTPLAVVSYASLNRTTYWSNGNESGAVNSDGNVSVWGVPVPLLVIASATTGSGLDAGDYQVVYTNLSSGGIESGAPEPASVTVGDNGAISLVLPAFQTGVSAYRVYMTSCNGSTLRMVGDTTSSATTITIGKVDLGSELMALNHVAPIPGQIVRQFNSHLLVAVGDRLHFTPPFNPHVFHPFSQHYRFPAQISLVQPVNDGIYVSTQNETWFMAGQDPRGFSKIILNQRGAIPGTGIDLPAHVFGDESANGRVAGWWDTEGCFCIGRASGQIARITEKTLSVDYYPLGSTAFIKKTGVERIITMFEGVGKSTRKQASDLTPTINTNGVSV